MQARARLQWACQRVQGSRCSRRPPSALHSAFVGNQSDSGGFGSRSYEPRSNVIDPVGWPSSWDRGRRRCGGALCKRSSNAKTQQQPGGACILVPLPFLEPVHTHTIHTKPQPTRPPPWPTPRRGSWIRTSAPSQPSTTSSCRSSWCSSTSCATTSPTNTTRCAGAGRSEQGGGGVASVRDGGRIVSG